MVASRCNKRRGKLHGEALVSVDAPVAQSSSASGIPMARVPTPALVYDQGRLDELGGVARRVRDRSGVRVLYAVKACAFSAVLQALAPSLDGFAVSSLFEARLVHDLYPNSPLHLTTPGLRDDEVDELADLCAFVTFNSENQLHRFGPRIQRYSSVGLRVNTGVSTVQDARYDPARWDSKLGIPLGRLPECLASAPIPVCGVHFHTNADSEDLNELEPNVQALVESGIGESSFDWVNFGGGYLFEYVSSFEPLQRSVALAKRHLANDVYVEPGAGLVRTAGYLVASVIDVFERDCIQVVILDTSVNHLPEVLEFGYLPEVEGSTSDGAYEYLLAGSSCLAGDVFGRYRFQAPLDIGNTVTFTEAGAYAQAKSHRFNGINLPSVWTVESNGRRIAHQEFNYADYLRHWMSNV